MVMNAGRCGWTIRGLSALALAAGLGACATTSQSASIVRVDDLVTRIEAVHLEAELAKETVYTMLLALRPVIVPTQGDPRAQFDTFLGALDASEQRAEKFERMLAPMEQSARQVFSRWEQDLRAIESDSMRELSRTRMQDTRVLYDNVLRTTKSSDKRLRELNCGLRDLALFLGHDFNAGSIASIEGEAYSLRDLAKQLGQDLDRCMQAAEAYVNRAAPLGVTLAPHDAPNTTTVSTPDTMPSRTQRPATERSSVSPESTQRNGSRRR